MLYFLSLPLKIRLVMVKSSGSRSYYCWSIFPLLVPAPNEFVSLAEMEDALLKNLFQGYQRWVRPIQRANDTIKVRFGLKISQLVDVVRRHTHVQTDWHQFATPVKSGFLSLNETKFEFYTTFSLSVFLWDLLATSKVKNIASLAL